MACSKPVQSISPSDYHWERMKQTRKAIELENSNDFWTGWSRAQARSEVCGCIDLSLNITRESRELWEREEAYWEDQRKKAKEYQDSKNAKRQQDASTFQESFTYRIVDKKEEEPYMKGIVDPWLAGNGRVYCMFSDGVCDITDDVIVQRGLGIFDADTNEEIFVGDILVDRYGKEYGKLNYRMSCYENNDICNKDTNFRMDLYCDDRKFDYAYLPYCRKKLPQDYPGDYKFKENLPQNIVPGFNNGKVFEYQMPKGYRLMTNDEVNRVYSERALPKGHYFLSWNCVWKSWRPYKFIKINKSLQNVATYAVNMSEDLLSSCVKKEETLELVSNV